MMNMEELISHHEKFAQLVLKKNRQFNPQIVYYANGHIYPTMLTGDSRKIFGSILAKINKIKDSVDWIIIMHEAYSFASKNKDEIKKILKKYGDLEEGYLAGDSAINWIFVIVVYWKNKDDGKFIKKKIIYKITTVTFDFKKLYEEEDFTDYLDL